MGRKQWSRRDLLRAGLAAAIVSSTFTRGIAAPTPSRPSALKPRYFCIIYLGGGMDAVLTTDPKTRAEVEPLIDVPYPANAIIDTGAGVGVGPLLAPMVPHMSRLAVVNGVRTRTVSHQSGATQISRMRAGVAPEMPSICDILGSHRDGQPLASLALGTVNEDDYSAGWFGAPSDVDTAGATTRSLLDELDQLAPEDLGRLAKLVRNQEAGLESLSRHAGAAVAAKNAEQTAAFLDKLSHATPFRLEVWDDLPKAQFHASILQRALWAMENDLASAIYVKSLRIHFDSHNYNLRYQTHACRQFFPVFARFLDELNRRRNQHGPLASETLVVAGGEVGRHPRLNHNLGKDHFPETPFFFYGKGIAPQAGKNVFGRTGRQMDARLISLHSGLPEVGGVEIDLTDIGTTLIRRAGGDPAVFGYAGQNLRFLEPT